MSGENCDSTVLELRSEIIRTIALRGEKRRGESDVLEVGWESASDYVNGAETVEIHGSSSERVHGPRIEMAEDSETVVNGPVTMKMHGNTAILAGLLYEQFIGPTVLTAGMSDDLAAGGGARVTSPTDIWLAGLIGMEEKPGTAMVDATLIEGGKLLMDREYGPGIHNYGTAVFNGLSYQTQATGFRQLYRVWKSAVRNLTPGGGGGGSAESAPAVSAPMAAAAGGGMLATSVHPNRSADAQEIADLARISEDAADASTEASTADELASIAGRPTLRQLLDQAETLGEAENVDEDAMTSLIRALTGDAADIAAPERPGVLQEAFTGAEDARVIDNPNWLEMPLAAGDAADAPAGPNVLDSYGHVDNVPPDAVDDDWQALQRRLAQAKEDVWNSIPDKDKPFDSAKFTGGRHSEAVTEIENAQADLRRIMFGLLEPHASDIGLSPRELRALDGEPGADLLARRYYKLAIDKAEAAGDVEKANEMRAALAGYDAMARQRMTAAIAEADRLRDFESARLPPGVDREELAAGYVGMYAELITRYPAEELDLHREEIFEQAELHGLAQVKVEQGYDPIPFLLEHHTRRGIVKGGVPEYIDTAMQDALEVLARHDPDMPMSAPDEAAGARVQLLWRRNEAIMLGDFDTAKAIQRQLDLFDADPARYADQADMRKVFRSAMDTAGEKPPAPPEGPATARDSFDEKFTELIRRREQADMDYQHGADVSGANKAGLHEAAHQLTLRTQRRLDDMMTQLAAPYLEEMGATPADIAALRTRNRAREENLVQQPMLLRQWFRYAMDQAEQSGDVARAEEMRQALADYDAVATRMIEDAIAEADWLAGFEHVPLSPEFDVDSAKAALEEHSNELMQAANETMSRDDLTMDELMARVDIEGKVANMMLRASEHIGEGRDPMPYLLEVANAGIATAGESVRPYYEDALMRVRDTMYMYDPSLSAATQPQPFDLANDLESMIWMRRQLFYAEDWDGALDMQRRIEDLLRRTGAPGAPPPDLPPAPNPVLWRAADAPAPGALDSPSGFAPADPPAFDAAPRAEPRDATHRVRHRVRVRAAPEDAFTGLPLADAAGDAPLAPLLDSADPWQAPAAGIADGFGETAPSAGDLRAGDIEVEIPPRRADIANDPPPPPDYPEDGPSWPLPDYDDSHLPRQRPPSYEVGGWVPPARGLDDPPAPRLDDAGASWRNAAETGEVSRPGDQLRQTDWANPAPLGEESNFRVYDDTLPDDFDATEISRRLNDRIAEGQDRLEALELVNPTLSGGLARENTNQRIANRLAELAGLEAAPVDAEPLPGKPQVPDVGDLPISETHTQEEARHMEARLIFVEELDKIEWPVPKETDPEQRRLQLLAEIDAFQAMQLAKVEGEDPEAMLLEMADLARAEYGPDDIRTKTWEGALTYNNKINALSEQLEFENDLYMEILAEVGHGLDPRAELRRMLDQAGDDAQKQRIIRDAMAWVDANLVLPARPQPQAPNRWVPDLPYMAPSSTITSADLPPDFPQQAVADRLTRQIDELKPEDGAVDWSAEQRMTLERARQHVISGKNPLPYMDTEIRRLELKQMEGTISGDDADLLDEMQKVRNVMDYFMETPPAASVEGLQPLPADFDAGGAMTNLRAGLEQVGDLDDAKQALAGIPAPPGILDQAGELLKGDDLNDALARYGAWSEAHGEAWEAAKTRVAQLQSVSDHRNLLVRQVEADLAAGINPMARIELERIQMREMMALDSDAVFRHRLAALDQVAGALQDSVPALPADGFGAQSDIRRYAVALGVDPETPASYEITDATEGFDYIDPIDEFDPDGVDGLYATLDQRRTGAMDDLVKSNPPAPEDGGPAPDAVRPAGLHANAGLHLQETGARLDAIMIQMLESVGFEADQIKGITDDIDELRKSGGDASQMQLRAWYKWSIAQVEAMSPAQLQRIDFTADEMRAVLANFDAFAEREMREALAYADWLQNFPGAPLSPTMDREALSADLSAEIDELLRPLMEYRTGDGPRVEDPEWHAQRADALALVKSQVDAGLDPVAAFLDRREAQIAMGVYEENYDGLLETILSLMARHDPNFRSFPEDAADLRAHTVWQRNEMLYLGDLDAALELQRKIEALDAAADPDAAEALERIDELVDLDSAEAAALRNAFGGAADDFEPVRPAPLQQDQWEAVRAGIPVEPGADDFIPKPGFDAPVPRATDFSDSTPLADGAAAHLLGDAADAGGPGLPPGDALTPSRGGLASATEAAETAASPEVIGAADFAAEELTTLTAVDRNRPRTQYPEVREAFARWTRETNRVHGAFDLTGVDESVQQMFRAWYVETGGAGRFEGADFEDLYATLQTQLLHYGGQSPPPGYAAGADTGTLTAWLALNKADMDLRQFARRFEEVIGMQPPPGFDMLRDLDDITKVRAALQSAADNATDADEAISLRTLVQMIDDYMYRTMTEALAAADLAAAMDESRLPGRLDAAYAARELETQLGVWLEGKLLSAGDDAPYADALQRALLDLREGTDPRPRIDAQIKFLKAQLDAAGDDPLRRSELLKQLDAHRDARMAVDRTMTKWTRPAPPAGLPPADFSMDASWGLLFDEGADGPQLAPHVPESVAADMEDLAQRYAAELGGELGAVDPADPAAVRQRIDELRRQAAEALENPVDDVLELDPGNAHRYSTLLESMDQEAYGVLDQAGLANNIDGEAIRARFPGLSAEFEDFVAATDIDGAGWTAAGVDPARIDAFETFIRQRGPLDALEKDRLVRFGRFLRHQRRRYTTRFLKIGGFP
ncbi:MAG: hypothetical protein OXH59_20325 [Rhodospirillaceae bacterium]|nr:hypothetical protein [Rhodospirillaceae bacterium]